MNSSTTSGESIFDSDNITGFEELIGWLVENGATIPSLRVRVGSTGRVAFASRCIKSGSLVLHLPRSLLITSDVVAESPVGLILLQGKLDLSLHARLAVFILEVKRHGGFWAPYVSLLPDKFPNSHYWFSENDLAELAGSYVLRTITRRRKRLHYEYRQLAAALSTEMQFSLEEYIWAVCCVESRVFDVRFDGKTKSRAMVPLADMPDHSPQPNILWGSESSRGFHMIAATDIKAGTVLTDRYWRKCNGLNFVTYGFCLSGNKYNTAEIRLPNLSSGHPCQQLAVRLGQERNGQRVFSVRADAETDDARHLFAYLRLCSVNSDTELPLDLAGIPVVPLGPVSRTNENEACRLLAIACRDRLSEFKTTIVKDLELLSDPSLQLPHRLAIQVRSDEKQVLSYFLAIADTGRLAIG